MEHRQPEQNGGRGGCGTAAWGLDDRATWFVQEAQNLLVRNAMTDMSVCVIEDRTMYTIRYDKYLRAFSSWATHFSHPILSPQIDVTGSCSQPAAPSSKL